MKEMIDMNIERDDLLSNIPGVIYRALPDEGASRVYISSRWEEWTGVSPADIQNSPSSWVESVHPDDRERLLETYAGTLVQGGDFKAGYRVIHKDSGRVFHLMDHAVLTRDSQGKTAGFDGLIVDVSEQKWAREKLDMLSLVVEQANEAVVITDKEGNIQYVNPAFESITGYEAVEVIGKNPGILKSGKQKEKFYRELWETINRGEVWKGHFLNRKKDGSFYEEESVIFPVKDAGGILCGFTKVARDVTEEMEMEKHLQQARKMEVIGRLAGGIAHDFNNLLTGIKGLVDLAIMDLKPGTPSMDYIEDICRVTDQAVDLVRQLLAFSRRQIISPRPIMVNSIIRDMERMIKRILGNNINISISLDPEVKASKMDPGQLEQVIMNLLVNARDAMPGGGELHIDTGMKRLEESDKKKYPFITPGEYVMLSVRDTGTGMDEETLSHIFEPFFTTKEKGKGTGLGLSTVFGLVKQARGFIIVESKPLAGTKFRVFLPPTNERVETRKFRQKGKSTAIIGGTETIMVVEDSEIVRKLIKRALNRAGYQPHFATSGSEALYRSEVVEGKISLLITDLGLPDTKGWKLARLLKKRIPDLKVLFMSGYSEEVFGENREIPEKSDFIGKPFSVKDFLIKVREILDR